MDLNKTKQIEEQKAEVEEKQEEVLASIRYAKRIQDAMLPSHTTMQEDITRQKKK